MAQVRIIAAHKDFHVAPFYIAPKFDELSKEFLTGQTWDSDPEKAKKQKENAKIVITEEDSYMIKHLMILNTEVEVDKAILNLIKTHEDIVAPSKDKVVPGIHRFYIEDKEHEAAAEITKIELEYEAMTKVKSLSMDELSDFGRICGLRVKDLSKKQLESEILRKAQKDPATVLALFKDPVRKQKVFLRKLLDKGTVRMENGAYKFGDEILGLNEMQAIEFLKDSNNSKLVAEFSKNI